MLLDSFLRYRHRSFDLDYGSQTGGGVASGDNQQEGLHVDDLAVRAVETKILQVLLRMSARHGFGPTGGAEPHGDQLSGSAHASLLYDSSLIGHAPLAARV